MADIAGDDIAAAIGDGGQSRRPFAGSTLALAADACVCRRRVDLADSDAVIDRQASAGEPRIERRPATRDS